MSSSEKSKCVVLGVTGGIAAYKACQFLRLLQNSGIDVHVIMTKNATQFINPITFETLSAHPVTVDTFERPEQWEVGHIALAKRADLFAVVPATANIIAKYACGIADDMLSTTLLAAACPVLMAPAMNSGMYLNAATQANLRTLEGRGVTFVSPGNGYLACGDEGVGRMEEPEVIAKRCLELLSAKQDMKGIRVCITAGPTREMLDPVRYITNRSSGKMGYALAEAAAARGAEVTLLSGPVNLSASGKIRVVPFISTEDLLEVALREVPGCDILVQAAAPSDYRPVTVAEQKIKKRHGEPLHVEFQENPDVAATLGKQKKDGQVFVGFAAETENVSGNAAEKLKRKNLDLIVANDVTMPGAGFDVDTNIVTIITEEQSVSLPLLTKRETAEKILDTALASFKRKNGI